MSINESMLIQEKDNSILGVDGTLNGSHSLIII